MANPVVMHPVTSSNLVAVGYDKEGQLLHVEFKNGLTYAYQGVPDQLYQDLLSAESLGSFFHKNIRTDYPYTKV